MLILKTSLFLVCTACLSNLQAATFAPVASNSSTLPNITHLLANQNDITSNTYLSNEAIKLTFTLNVAAAHIGKTGNIFIVGKYANHFYMLNGNNQWEPWNQQLVSLKPFTTKSLLKTEQLTAIKNSQYPAGEYLIYVGYQIDAGSVFYSEAPVSLAIFDKEDPSLHRISNKEVLTEFFDRGQISQNKGIGTDSFSPNATPLPAAPTATVSDVSTGPAVSQTNLQEVGVDESDRIKVQNDQLFTLEACPKDASNECLGLYRMSASPATTTLISRLELDNHSYRNGMLYLPTTDANTPAQQLIYINDSMSYPIYSIWRYPWYWQNNKTEIKFIDVSQPSAMQVKQTISINSGLLSSRVVNNVLYLVTRKNPEYIYPTPIQPVSEILTEPLISSKAPDVVILPDPLPPKKDIDNLLPTIAFDNGDTSPLVQATDCYVPASSSNKVIDNTLVTVTAIPLKAPKSYYSVCVAGAVDTFYMSTQALYLASSLYPYQYSGNNIVYNQAQEMRTEIHKFSLAADALVYKGSAAIPGHLGWEVDKQPFRMGENNDILKVATSLGDNWSNNNSRTRVTVLQEDTVNKQLKEISSIDNLGKPGERLYAARFIQNRGYLVTFRTTDPLYVLDFTEPTKPEVIGELKVNGYSDYLHPIGDNFLLGIGKDAIPDTTSSFGDGRGAWYQGVKIALYDVSSKENLKEVDSLIIGKRGTDSAALSDHHALTWLASGNLATLAIPVELHNNRYPANYFGYNYNYDYSLPSSYYEWTHTGLYTFTIDTGTTPKITFERRLIANTNDLNIYNNYSGQGTYNDRAVIQGSSVHYLHDNRILSTAITP